MEKVEKGRLEERLVRGSVLSIWLGGDNRIGSRVGI